MENYDLKEEKQFLKVVKLTKEEIEAQWGLRVGETLLYFHAPENNANTPKTYCIPPTYVITNPLRNSSMLDINAPPEEKVEEWVAWNVDERFFPFAVKTKQGKVVLCDFHHTADVSFAEPFVKAMDALMKTDYYDNYIIDKVIVNSQRIQKITVEVIEDKEKLILGFKRELEKIRSLLMEQMNLQRSYAQKLIQEARDEAQTLYQQGIIEGIKVGIDLRGWSFDEEYGRFVYRKTIKVKFIKKNNRIKEAQTDKLYVKGLCLFYDKYDRRWRAKAEASFHPNVADKVCLGDLEKASLEELMRNLPEVLQTANLDSAYDSPATVLATELFHGTNEKGVEVFSV